MKKILLLSYLLVMTTIVAGQEPFPGSRDVVGLSGWPSEPQLVEAEDQSFYWVSGSGQGDEVNHALLGEVYSDFYNLFFIKYDRKGNAQKSNYIRGAYRALNASSFKGGLNVMASAVQDVEASGQTIPIGVAEQLEILATYDPDCNLEKIISLWNMGPSEYVNSESVMDPQDGSIYVYGLAFAPMDLVGYGIVGKDVSQSYFYVIKYKRNLELEWVYNAGFDMDASGTSPYFGSIDVHPGNDGTVLVTGSYASESSPLIHGNSLPAYMDSYGMFAVMLDAAGTSQWVQDGNTSGSGWGTLVFEGYPMPDGDFILAGACNTGYFKLGNAEIIFPGGVGFENMFVYRMRANGDFVWGRAIQNMRPNQDKKKKSAESEVFRAYIDYDAINWRNKILYMTGYFNTTTDFSIAGRSLDITHPDGIFVAAIDMDDGTELWGYGLTSEYPNIYGFDVDRSGSVSLFGVNHNVQDMEGIDEKPLAPGVTDFMFHVGLDHEGRGFWYNNLHLLTGPNYSSLHGVDLLVLPNGEVFSSMYMNEVNNLAIGSYTLPASNYTYSSWLVELKSDIKLGGLVIDEQSNPVFPGLVRAYKKSPWGSYPLVDSALIQDDGSYIFTDLYPGTYALKAVTNPEQYPDGIPTYYRDEVRWQLADLIPIAPDTNSIHRDIFLREIPKFTSMDGSGELSGTLSTEEGTFLKATMAQPAKKTGVILLGKAKKSTMAGEVVAYVETDEMGMFVIDNVPDGEYILVVNVTGLEMLSTHEVTIAGNQIVSGLNYTVGNEGIYAGWPTKVTYLENKTLNIWPNPGEGLIMMDLPAAGEYSVRIYSTDGRLIRSEAFRSAGGVTTLDISVENKGLYILSIEGPETKTTRKYIKK